MWVKRNESDASGAEEMNYRVRWLGSLARGTKDNFVWKHESLIQQPTSEESL